MTVVLRFLRDKRRWDSPESGEYPWLMKGEFPADTFIDLITEDNTLSVWLIEDDESNLERVLGAFASTRKDFDKLDYILFNFQALMELGLKIQEEKGNTPDESANNRWHVILYELSAQKVLLLAGKLYFEGIRKRKLMPEIRTIIVDRIKAGNLNKASLNFQLAAKAEKFL